MFKYFFPLMILALVFVSCKKDSDADGDDAKVLSFNFDFNVGNEALSYGQNYTINGATVSFETAQYYIGGIQLTTPEGTISFNDQYLLATPNASAVMSNETEANTINSVNFFVGVAPAENSQTEMDFTEREENDPLSVKDPSMHWSWNTGYKFLRVDGMVDTDADGNPDTAIAYHLGSDALLKNLSINFDKTLVEGNNDVTFTLDLNAFFSGVDLTTELDTHTGNNLPLAMTLQGNLDTALSVQ